MPSLGTVLIHATRPSATFLHTHVFLHTLAPSHLPQNDFCSRSFCGSLTLSDQHVKDPPHLPSPALPTLPPPNALRVQTLQCHLFPSDCHSHSSTYLPFQEAPNSLTPHMSTLASLPSWALLLVSQVPAYLPRPRGMLTMSQLLQPYCSPHHNLNPSPSCQ